MLFDAALDGPTPPPVVPNTVKVYGVPLVKPVTVMGDVAELPVIDPGDEIAVYVIDPEPKSEGTVKATVAVPDPVAPAVAVPIVGAPGILGQMPCLA
jgi:hypothetical protein